MKKLIIAVIVCSLVAFPSCKAKSTTSTTATAPPSVQELQTQINDLSSLVNAYSNVISRLQSKVDALETQVTATTSTPSIIPPVSEPDLSVVSAIDDMTAKIDKLNTQVRILQENIMVLQDNMKGNATNIGTNSMTVNGLDVTFILNGIEVGITGSTIPSTAQFAVKITNLTNSIVSNLEVTGTITILDNISANMAAGYPQLTDAAALCTMVYSYTGSNTINFEAYGNKGSLSIQVGGSITIRPKISIMASANNKLPATSFLISLKAITYDSITPK